VLLGGQLMARPSPTHLTCTSDAPLMTWKLVTMWPEVSQMKPLPWPAKEGGFGGG